MDRFLSASSLPFSRSFLAVIASLAIIFAAAGRDYFRRYPVSSSVAICIYLAFTLLLVLSLAAAWPSNRRSEQTAARYRPLFVFLPIWCSPYFLYAASTGDFRWTALFKLLAIAVPPVAIYSRFPPRNSFAFGWQDACVAVLLVGFVLSGQLRGIWNVPTNLDFMSRLFLITVASWCWTFIRVVPELGYSLRVSGEVVKQAAINFALFAVIAIPSSLALHFTRWNPRWPGVVPFLLNYLEIFLFIALLEELFFRGFLQSLLSRKLESWVAGQALVSVLFGLFHIFHAPFPNWRYVALASVAGWFYGSAFRTTGSLMASSLLHAAVDSVWRTWLWAR
jgi:membrane protease YdiL (CAAX protease family)